MFNTDSDDMFTVLCREYGSDHWDHTMHVFEDFDQALEYVKRNSSWDCRPHGGRMDEWYDAGSGCMYRVVSCDDKGYPSDLANAS